MFLGELPGMYYGWLNPCSGPTSADSLEDHAKGKYFKITADNNAPQASQYSSSNVKKARVEKGQRNRREARARIEEQQLVQRSSISRFSTAFSRLDRETGRFHGALSVHSSTKEYLDGLDRRNCIDWKWEEDEKGARIGPFVYESHTRRLIYSVPRTCGHGDGLFGSYLENNTNRKVAGRYTKALSFHLSTISSISLSSARTLVVTTTGSTDPPRISVTRLADRATHGVDHDTQEITRLELEDGPSLEYRPPNIETIWTSAPNPFTSSPTGSDDGIIAVGASDGVFILRSSPQTRRDWECTHALRTTSDVLATEWLSPTTLAAGLRDSNVHLYDPRSHGSSMRLRHAASVTGLKRGTSEYEVIVSGLKQSLSLYDLRMARYPESRKVIYKPGQTLRGPEYGKRKRKRTPKEWLVSEATSSEPVFSLEYSNAVYYPIGLDVHPGLGILAAAEPGAKVQIYSLRSGKKVKTCELLTPEEKEWHWQSDGDHWAGCLRFVESDGEAPKLMASVGSKIVELAW